MVKNNPNCPPPSPKGNALTLNEVGEKVLKYVATLPKQSSAWGRIEITFEYGKPQILKVQKNTLAKNVV